MGTEGVFKWGLEKGKKKRNETCTGKENAPFSSGGGGCLTCWGKSGLNVKRKIKKKETSKKSQRRRGRREISSQAGKRSYKFEKT